jgi:beta-aspartyl-peptidase (threonine type)
MLFIPICLSFCCLKSSMKRVSAVICVFMILACSSDKKRPSSDTPGNIPITIVIHGGAGTISRDAMTPEKEKNYRDALRTAIDKGYDVLANGGSSTNAVIEVITFLEDSPLFNAGKGSVFTHEGTNEMDASIMDGKTLMAGAVAAVTNIRNPIRAAHAVMTKSEHVFLSGKGAEEFARDQGLEIVDPTYFFDSTRYEQWQKALLKNKAYISEDLMDEKFGTVGCVALDAQGNIAAGTSTGGMTNKKFGRIGDSPIIGAGTYADNQTCGISSTGHGEFFIRLAVAHNISAIIENTDATLEEAANKMIHEKLTALGGTGGVIGLTKRGEIVMTFNTEGMFRGFRRVGEEAQVFIYNDESSGQGSPKTAPR